jgi:hypothetical protein
MHNKSNPEDKSLNLTMRGAAFFAALRLKMSGHLEPTFLGETPSDVFAISGDVPDEGALKAFADQIHLTCVAKAATAGVFVVEATFTTGRDEASNISKSSGCQEGVYLSGATVAGDQAQWFVPVRRDSTGGFIALDQPQILPPGTIAKYLPRLLPSQPPSEHERQTARLLLAARGLSVDGGSDGESSPRNN